MRSHGTLPGPVQVLACGRRRSSAVPALRVHHRQLPGRQQYALCQTQSAPRHCDCECCLRPTNNTKPSAPTTHYVVPSIWRSLCARLCTCACMCACLHVLAPGCACSSMDLSAHRHIISGTQNDVSITSTLANTERYVMSATQTTCSVMSCHVCNTERYVMSATQTTCCVMSCHVMSCLPHRTMCLDGSSGLKTAKACQSMWVNTAADRASRSYSQALQQRYGLMYIHTHTHTQTHTHTNMPTHMFTNHKAASVQMRARHTPWAWLRMHSSGLYAALPQTRSVCVYVCVCVCVTWCVHRSY